MMLLRLNETVTSVEALSEEFTASLHAIEQLILSWQKNQEEWNQLLLQVFGHFAPVDFNGIAIEILNGQTMAGLHGAYTPVAPDGDECIYIYEEWLATASAEAIQAVLLEEIGHAIDHRLNQSNDTTGDEGAIFSALVRGVAIPVLETNQHDHHTLLINGQLITVEASTPTFSSAATNTDGTKVVLTYNEILSSSSAPASAFVVTTDGFTNEVTGVDISGSNVELNLAETITNNQTVTVAYTDPSSSNDTNAVQDTAGDDADSLTSASVSNNSTVAPNDAPTITSPSIKGYDWASVFGNNANWASGSADLRKSDYPSLTEEEFILEGFRQMELRSNIVAFVAIYTDNTKAEIVRLRGKSRVSGLRDNSGNGSYSRTTSGQTVYLQENQVSAATSILGTPNDLLQNRALEEGSDELTQSGSLSVADTNTTDTVTTSVSLSVTGTSDRSRPSAPTDAEFLSMLQISPSPALDSSQSSQSLTWTFDTDLNSSSVSSIKYLHDNETLGLTYTITVTDNQSPALSNNESISFSISGVNGSPDVIAPNFSSATTNADGTKVVLTYDEGLSATTAAATAFSVTTDGDANTVTTVDISSSTVELTLTETVKNDQTVTVAYTDPSSANDTNAVQDPAGNDAVSLTTISVSNNSTVAGTAPTFFSAGTNTDGTKIGLIYDDALSATTAAASAFTVTTDGDVNTVTTAEVSGSAVVLTLTNTVKKNQTVTVSYTDPTSDNDSNAIQDSNGNDAASLSNRAVSNNSTFNDAVAPVLITPTEGTISESVDSTDTNNSGLSGTVLASDANSEDTLTYGIAGGLIENGFSTLAGSYGSFTLNTSSGAYTYTPNNPSIEALCAGVISDSFTVSVTDGSYTTTAPYIVSLMGADDSAIITGDTSGSAEEDTSAITGNLSATDVEGLTDNTYFSIETGNTPANGFASIDPETGAWSYTPVANFHGNDQFTVTVTDDCNGTTTQQIDLTITPAPTPEPTPEPEPTPTPESEHTPAQAPEPEPTPAHEPEAEPTVIDLPDNLGDIDSDSVSRHTPTAVADITADQINELSAESFQGFNAAQIEQLSNEAIRSLDSEQVEQLDPDALAGLDSEQIDALKPKTFQALSAEQIAEITDEAISAIDKKQIKQLEPDAIAGFQADQVDDLTPSTFKAFSADQLAEFTPDAAAGFNAEQIDALKPNTFQALSAEQIAEIDDEAISAIDNKQIKQLEPDAIAGFQADQVDELTPSTFKGLSADQLAEFTPAAVDAFTPSQIKQIKPIAIQGFTAQQLETLEATQVEALPKKLIKVLEPEQLSGLTGEAITGLTKGQLKAFPADALINFSESQIASIPSQSIPGLKPKVLNSMNQEQIQAFTNDQLDSLSRRQLRKATSFLSQLTSEQRVFLGLDDSNRSNRSINPLDQTVGLDFSLDQDPLA